uniref:Uncharacterized protein n=1 Tax=Aegilops tauschii subsp. strangulata TaxID=200361 RepID=A0A453J5A1_AEGTS
MARRHEYAWACLQLRKDCKLKKNSDCWKKTVFRLSFCTVISSR